MSYEPMGWGRVSAAVVGAPAAGFLGTLAVLGLLPISDDLRLTLVYLVALPLSAAASCFALVGEGGLRAWAVSAAILAASVALWWLNAGGHP